MKEFESYIQAEYILGINLVNDLFSKLFSMPKAKDISESIKMSTEALNILRTIKGKKLWPKFSEEHLEKIISRCLMRRDSNEFVQDWAKERAKSMLANEATEDTDDEDGTGIDMNKTITEEVTKGSLEEKKDFLVLFMKRKLLEMGTKQATARTLGEDKSPERKPKKSVRFKRGDRVFRVLELNEEDFSSDSDELEDFEAIFTANEDIRKKEPGRGKKKTKFSSKKCPIRCSRKEHSNGMPCRSVLQMQWTAQYYPLQQD